MSISALENLNQTISDGKTPSPEVLRNTAQQFEAVLLMQLTSAMNAKSDDDGEESLFGSDSGTDLAKKMFSEQMATTISQSGGVGLADMIMRQFGADQPKTVSGKMNKLSNAIAAVKDIRENAGLKNFRAENKVNSLINKSAEFNSIKPEIFTGNPNDVEIISTYADELADKSDGDNFKPQMLNGKILNSTRPRTVPDNALADKNSLSADVRFSSVKTSGKVEFQMPVSGKITSNFGNRFHPIDQKIKFHDGIDIAVPQGTPIGAAADGIVKFAGRKGGYGNLVIIEHADGNETFYGHNQKLLVKEGQFVSAGEKISLSGSTGKSTGPHLHFEVRENGRAVDPRKYVSNVLPKNADKRE